MQELLEYYFIGLTLKMEGGVGSGSRSSGPSGQGPAGQAGSSGTSTPGPAGSGVLPTNPENAYSFDSLDNLLNQLRQQISQGTGPSEQEVVKKLQENVVKLNRWEQFVAKDFTKKLAPLTSYHQYFEIKEYYDFEKHCYKIPGTGIDVFHNGRIAKAEIYANAQKNLCNKQKDN